MFMFLPGGGGNPDKHGQTQQVFGPITEPFLWKIEDVNEETSETVLVNIKEPRAVVVPSAFHLDLLKRTWSRCSLRWCAESFPWNGNSGTDDETRPPGTDGNASKMYLHILRIQIWRLQSLQQLTSSVSRMSQPLISSLLFICVRPPFMGTR